QVGLAYAWNTAGAIAGSLAGGFGLLPLLSAPGVWRLATLLLVILGVATLIVAARERQFVSAAFSIVLALVAVASALALGPTALWRHSGIGAGRAETPESINATRDWVLNTRRTLVWDVDGRESSVALVDASDY